jgi:signal transduction histidine kinase
MPRQDTTAARWPARRLLIGIVTILLVLTAVSVGAAVLALNQLYDARTFVVDQLDPVRRQAQELSTVLVDQESGLRGFVLTGREEFLQPYHDGRARERTAIDESHKLLAGRLPGVAARFTEAGQLADRWRSEYAEPTVSQIRAVGPTLVVTADPVAGKAMFDDLRSTVGKLQADLDQQSNTAREQLSRTASSVLTLLIGIGVVLVLLVSVVAVILHRILITPLSGLAEQVRKVASGDFQRSVDTRGPKELAMLSRDIDAMRQRIVQDLDAVQQAHQRLDLQSQELKRSNTELEQFAYVASHDLQEPLRKVASFCQLLQRRYGGHLDERADQYIGFAVDGAKRMQVLINDLLAFSRVGRLTRQHTMVDCNDLVDQVVANVADTIEETGAEVTVADLPRVSGEASLLSTVFQNLISNALKFRGDDPPRVDVSARRTGEFWTFAVQDNGIGIDPEYAERIFIIFQRLHHKDAYPGTGIGLAMCRKIIEYHGGTIRLDTSREIGTTFEFTLPAVEEQEKTDE